MRGLVYVVLWVTLGGCKSSTSALPKSGETCAELFEELDPLNDGLPYEPPPSFCESIVSDKLPFLEMPRNEVMETYLAFYDPSHVLAVDYMAYPVPRVIGGSVVSEGAFENPGPSVLVLDECPKTLTVADIFPFVVENDVVVSRVRLDEPEQRSRSARVFVPKGDRTISIDPAGVTTEATIESSWYVLYEPAHGPARIAIRRLPHLPESIVLHGMPDGAAVLALFRSESLAAEDDGGVVYGATGFSQGWRFFVEDWYGAIVPPGTATGIRLERRVFPSNFLRLTVDEPVTLDEEGSTALVVLTPEDGEERAPVEVSLPCNVSYRVTLDGFADATLTTDSTVLLEPGIPRDGVAACDPEDFLFKMSIDGSTDSHRSAVVVVSYHEVMP